MIIFNDFKDIESGFIFKMVSVHHFSPVQVEAVKRPLSLLQS